MAGRSLFLASHVDSRAGQRATVSDSRRRGRQPIGVLRNHSQPQQGVAHTTPPLVRRRHRMCKQERLTGPACCSTCLGGRQQTGEPPFYSPSQVRTFSPKVTYDKAKVPSNRSGPDPYPSEKVPGHSNNPSQRSPPTSPLVTGSMASKKGGLPPGQDPLVLQRP